MDSPTSADSAPSAANVDNPSVDNPELQLQAEAQAQGQARSQSQTEPVTTRTPQSRLGAHSQNDGDAVSATTSTPARPSSTPASISRQDALPPNGRPFPPDGRVKNPVPKRLKSVDKKNGNFAVLHIDLTKSQMSERDAAAKRTSMGTEAAAKLANRDGYQPVRRSRLAWNPTDGSSQPSQPYPPGAQPGHGHGSSHPPPSQPPAFPFPGLSPAEAKSQQARLLTLLRSLHPVLVIDQLCTALAFFGGIPGAPPPADGKFPESAASNGPGALFVGWMSEIFPAVDGPIAMAPPPGHPAAGALGIGTPINGLGSAMKKSRGRPKGSKGKYARKDKGVKKSSQRPTADAPSGSMDDTQTATAEGTSAAPIEVVEDTQPSNEPTSTPARPEASQTLDPDTSAFNTPGGRKRGRPKGSKNRPKNAPNGPSSAATSFSTTHQSPTAQVSATGQGSAATETRSEPTPPAPQRQQQAPTGTVQNNVPTGINVSAATSTTPTHQANSQHGSGNQAAQPPRQPTNTAKAPTRKRKSAQPVQNDGHETANVVANELGAQNQESQVATTAPIASQGPPAKRRRTSKAKTQTPTVGNPDSQSSAADISGSPAMNESLNGGVARSALPSGKKASRPRAQQQKQQQQQQQPQGMTQVAAQADFNGRSLAQPKQRESEQQRQFEHLHHLQQQHQQRPQQRAQVQRQSPNMNPTSSQQQQGAINNHPATSRPAQRPQNQYAAQQQQQQQQAFITPQQSQMPNQYGHGQLGSNMLGSQQHRNMGHLNNGQQTPSSSAPSAMAQFQGHFGSQNSHIDMGYGNFGDTELEALLAEPESRDHLYRAIGR